MKNILLTGASGFVGQRYMKYNQANYYLKTVSLRTTSPEAIDFENINTIVHLAGKAHQMQKIEDRIYFQVNYELTKQLADIAKAKGIGHFIFVSTIKVYGENREEKILDESSPCQPEDAYGKSKLQAEEYLKSIETNDFKVAIVRPPLVYGPKVKGNLIRLLQLLGKKYPLPFKGINNQRSMVFLDNLIELLNSITNQKASGIFIAGDKTPLSTSELVGLMNKGLGLNNRTFKIPSFSIPLLKKIKPALINRLFGSFIVDNQNTNQKLNFIPPYSSEYGIQQMAEWYIKENQLSDNFKLSNN